MSGRRCVSNEYLDRAEEEEEARMYYQGKEENDEYIYDDIRAKCHCTIQEISSGLAAVDKWQNST